MRRSGITCVTALVAPSTQSFQSQWSTKLAGAGKFSKVIMIFSFVNMDISSATFSTDSNDTYWIMIIALWTCFLCSQQLYYNQICFEFDIRINCSWPQTMFCCHHRVWIWIRTLELCKTASLSNNSRNFVHSLSNSLMMFMIQSRLFIPELWP